MKCKQRSYRWMVNYYVGGGEERTRKRAYFKKKVEAEEFAGTKKEELQAFGSTQHEINHEEYRAVIAFREIVGALPDSIQKPSLAHIVEDFRKRAEVRQKSMTVHDLIERYLDALNRRRLSDSYLYTIRKRLDRFEGEYGEWMACDVSSEVIGDWLLDIDLSPGSVNHFRAALVQLFGFGLKLKAVEENHAAVVEKLKNEPTEIGYLGIEEIKTLLKHASSEILPAVAIGLFAGVRRAELTRMDWGEVDFEQGHIEIKAKKSKSAARRIIPMRDALRQWLEPYALSVGEIMPSEMIYRSRLDEACQAAKIIEWPHNALRHSFASYHYAAFADAGQLAQELGHSNTRMIFEHYRALVAPRKGKDFWKVLPS